jgi:creatinine amidohydrolase
VLSDYDIAYKDLGNTVPKDDGHAGMLETSRVLAIRPDLVKMNRAKESLPKFPPYRVLNDAERYFPTGYMGYPDRATPELGAKSNESIALQLTELIENMIKEGKTGE